MTLFLSIIIIIISAYIILKVLKDRKNGNKW